MYQLRNTTSFQPNRVVKPSVNVPAPKATMPSPHQKR